MTALLLSATPDNTGRLAGNVHVGATNGRQFFGLGVDASLAGDAIWRLVWRLPGTLPGGQLKLDLLALANSNANVAKVNAKWGLVAASENPDTATLTAEGTTTITWASGDADKYIETKIVLDANTPVASKQLVMDLTFEASGWTLAVVSTWYPFLIWE